MFGHVFGKLSVENEISLQIDWYLLQTEDFILQILRHEWPRVTFCHSVDIADSKLLDDMSLSVATTPCLSPDVDL